MPELLKPEIQEGSLVEIELHGDPELQQQLKRWEKVYEQYWPMKVFRRKGPEHVVLIDQKSGKVIHFGNTCDPSFHVGHLKLHC